MFAEKYRPYSYDDLSFNKDVTHFLKNIPFRNFVIYGQRGSGKSTRVDCYLYHIFGENILKKKLHTITLGKNTQINYLSSNYHIEIDFSKVGNHDKLVVSEFIANLSHSKNIITNSFRFFVFKNAHKLSILAQNSLRHLLDTTFKSSRYIFICNDVAKLIDSLRSRLVMIRNPSPQIDDIHSILKNIALKENLITGTRIINIIIENSQKLTNILCLNIIINMFQMSYLTEKYLRYDNLILTYFDQLINIINKININSTITNMNFAKIREQLYIIFASNIDINILFTYLCKYFIKHIKNDRYKFQIIDQAAKYQNLMISGNKELLYVESFILKIIEILRYPDVVKIKTIRIKKNIDEKNIIKN